MFDKSIRGEAEGAALGAKTAALLEYQEIELQIVDIKRQLARKERQVAAQMKTLDTARGAVAAEHAELRKTQMQFDELDLEIKARTAHIAKIREQLNSVRTNKEYAALLSQLNNEKADTNKIESRALELMGAIEAKKTAMGTQTGAEQVENTRLAALQAELDGARKRFADRLADLERQRREKAALVDREALSLFQRLAERYEGEAMAEAICANSRRDEFVCGGCNISLTADMSNALRIRDDTLTCKSCGRILYIK